MIRNFIFIFIAATMLIIIIIIIIFIVLQKEYIVNIKMIINYIIKL